MAAEEVIAGSGSRLMWTYYTVGSTQLAQLAQLSGSSRGPGTRCAMGRPHCSRRDARLGYEVAHRVGGASRLCELSQAALTRWHCGHTVGAWYDICTLGRPSDSFSVGASEDRAHCR